MDEVHIPLALMCFTDDCGNDSTLHRRLESLLNFQTVITELTGMGLSNCSLLDEATAAAEAMTMCSAIARGKKQKWLMSVRVSP